MCISPNAFNQNRTTQIFNNSIGVANTIYDLAQDSKSFIWAATDKGLFRYDGIDFLEYNSSNGLASNEVLYVYADTNDVVYALNFPNELNYIVDGVVYNKDTDPSMDSILLKNVPVQSFLKSENTLLLASIYGEYFFRIKYLDGQLLSKLIKLPVKSKILSLASCKDAYYVFIPNDGPAADREFIYYVFQKDEIIFQGIICDFLPSDSFSADDKFYFGDAFSNRIFIYDVMDDYSLKRTNEVTIKDRVKSIDKFNDSLSITLHGDGCLIFNDNEQVQILEADTEVNSCIVDKENNIWIGSMNDGLFLQKESLIQKIPLELNESKLNSFSIYATDDKLIVGYNKLMLSVLENGVNTFYSLSAMGWHPNGKVRDFAMYENDKLLCATDEGLYLFNLETKKSRLLYKETSKSINKGAASNYLVGTSSKFYIINDVNSLDTTTISAQRTISSFFDDNGLLWAGTLYGLRGPINPTDPNTFNNNSFIPDRIVNDIVGHKNVIFAATSSGLCVIRDGQVECLDQDDGLIGNNCIALEIYKDKLCVATSNGLSILDFDTESKLNKVTNYTEFDGLISNDLNALAILKDELYLVSSLGVCKLNLNHDNISSIPYTNIIGAKADGEELNMAGENRLKSNTQTLEFEFAGMSFGFGGKDISYQYKLDPIHTEWVNTKRSSVNFSSLEPLDYKFTVQAINNKGVYSKNIANINFSIKPTLFQSRWFKILVFLLALLVAWCFWKYKASLDEKKQEASQKMSELELDAIRAQINPHFIYNCLNSIKNTVAKGENNDAEKQISIFAKLIRQTLSISKQNFIKLEDEINYLDNYLKMEKLRFKEKLQYSIHAKDIDFIEKDIMLPSMLVQPYVENAVKYGMQNESLVTIVKVDFSIIGKLLICTIDDNGPGLNTTLKKNRRDKSSYGMEISSTRAKTYNEIYKANIEIQAMDKMDMEKDGAGTLIVLKMNLNEK